MVPNPAPLSPEECLARLRLYRSENVGPATYYQLINRYGSGEKALEALPHLAEKGGRSQALRLYSQQEAQDEWDRHIQMGAVLVIEGMPEYPKSLQCLSDAPPVLSMKGNLNLLETKMLAIVGSRNASVSGRKLARRFAEVMGQRGYGVISGLARGIDTAAHEGSVATGTLAVIAGGVDKIYPPENRNLYHQIAEQGLLVAESPLGMDPHATLFPRRNRLISALSCGVLVIEAALHSGSLITAKYAASQGKDVFVVPGSPLDARYQGSLQLLKQGCVLTTGPSDIFDVLERNYALTFHESSQAYDASLYEAAEDMQAGEDVVKGKILEALSFTPTLMDDVMRAVPANANQVLAQVLELELAGLVMRHPGNLIARTV